MGKHGTSNIAHKRELGVRWNENGKYAHDYEFVRKLLVFKTEGRFGLRSISFVIFLACMMFKI